MTERVRIKRLPSGVPGLDEVLGGGFPEYSFNLLAGGPGGGKTTLAHQIVFANATVERPALYISILGEPPIKLLRYQQQYSFFDPSILGKAIRYVHLGQDSVSGGLSQVLSSIVRAVDSQSPSMVVVDSFRAVLRQSGLGLAAVIAGEMDLQNFIQRLALHLTSSEATTFLLGEYIDTESDNNAVFTVADGIIWLHQALDRNSMVRKLQVVKMRGQCPLPGLHPARISDHGLRVFPRSSQPEPRPESVSASRRLSTGVSPLDEMLGGGIPTGHTTLVVGPSGSGKTILSNQFLLEGGRQGECGVIAVFEKRPREYLEMTPHGPELAQLIHDGKLQILYLRPPDLSIDEILLELRAAILRTGAKRAVIDSLSGLELALAPTFREDFRESLSRMLGTLTSLGVTVMSTVEQCDSYTDFRLTPQTVSFLTDAVITQRYVKLEGSIKRVMSVVKVRASRHSNELREYEITASGLTVLPGSLGRYEGPRSGSPQKREESERTEPR